MRKLSKQMRILHRYIGYFMAGIMAVYAISGILLIYRDTDFLKSEKKYDKVVEKNIPEEKLGKELKIKGLEVKERKDGLIIFAQGTYNSKTGQAIYTKKELPYFLKKMTDLHKAESKNSFGVLNTVFGISLLFFVISSFWMFNPKSKIFRKGLAIALIGSLLAIILLFVN